MNYSHKLWAICLTCGP